MLLVGGGMLRAVLTRPKMNRSPTNILDSCKIYKDGNDALQYCLRCKNLIALKCCNDTQHNDTQHNDTQHNDTQRIEHFMTLSVMSFL